jgi:hypothetical protein
MNCWEVTRRRGLPGFVRIKCWEVTKLRPGGDAEAAELIVTFGLAG